MTIPPNCNLSEGDLVTLIDPMALAERGMNSHLGKTGVITAFHAPSADERADALYTCWCATVNMDRSGQEPMPDWLIALGFDAGPPPPMHLIVPVHALQREVALPQVG